MVRAQTSHPLDPLSAAEISVAVATVRAAGATPEVHIFLLNILSVWVYYREMKQLCLIKLYPLCYYLWMFTKLFDYLVR